MTTYKEIIYMIFDMLKLNSDDSGYTTDHLLFLMSKQRSILLKQLYQKSSNIPQENYQTLCVDLEKYSAAECAPNLLRSTKLLPKLLFENTLKVYSPDYTLNELFTPVSMERFRFTGHNKYQSNMIYCTLNPDWHLYLKSCNPQFKYLQSVKITGVFENDLEAQKLMCSDNEEYTCDILDRRFPLEDALIEQLVLAIVKILYTVIYSPADIINNGRNEYDTVNKDPNNNQQQQQPNE